MRHHPYNTALFLISLLLFSLIPPLESRRGGGGMGGGGSRGSSGSRSSSGGFGRTGGSGSRSSSSSGGGLFGGGGGGVRNEYSRGKSLGGNRANQGTGSGGGGWNTHRNSGGGSLNDRGSNAGSKGGFLGGLFGRKHGQSSSHQAGYGSRRSWGGGGGGASRWANSGIGSRSRGSTFKNMIVGAAAGYLTYQAGKAIIRAAAGPMMWNNRPYYWGSNYYRQSPGHTNMCRMPIDSSDPQFGNVYFQDQSRPREITWGCGYYEYCCGYECCRGGGGAASDRIGGRGSSIGYALVIAWLLLLICLGLCCAFPLVTRYVRRRQFGNAN
uniref:CX domain-containing protein n=1 Tax=Caenorhabditis japonica TaxID=281687 RepID=A0A8R1DX39_CAEJA